jgi:hypothetical protein
MGPEIEEWRIPQNVPCSEVEEVCECETPDAMKGQAMTSPAKSRTRSFIAVNVMRSFGSASRGKLSFA